MLAPCRRGDLDESSRTTRTSRLHPACLYRDAGFDLQLMVKVRSSGARLRAQRRRIDRSGYGMEHAICVNGSAPLLHVISSITVTWPDTGRDWAFWRHRCIDGMLQEFVAAATHTRVLLFINIQRSVCSPPQDRRLQPPSRLRHHRCLKNQVHYESKPIQFSLPPPPLPHQPLHYQPCLHPTCRWARLPFLARQRC